MIDLTKKGLPNIVEINGVPYSVYTDFRKWMQFEIDVGKLRPGENMDVTYLFKNQYPASCNLSDLFVFSRPQCILPRSTGRSDVIALDYKVDADYIYAAFMSKYKIDLCDIEELHWHKFLALFKGLKDEMICDIMHYRCYEPDNSKRDVYSELREMWRIERESPGEQVERIKFNSYFE